MNYSMEQNDDSDGDTSIPSIINRTAATRSEVPKKQKSKFKGVFRVGKKFKAQIQVNGVQNYLGLYESEDEAAKAYDMHARALLLAKAKTNFHYDESCDLPNADSLCIPPTQGQGVQQLRPPLEDDIAPTDVASRISRDTGMRSAQSRRSYVGIKARRRRKTEIIGGNINILIGVGEAAGMMPPATNQKQQQYALHPSLSQDMQLHRQQQLRQHQLMHMNSQHNGSLNTGAHSSIHPLFSGSSGNVPSGNDRLFNHSQSREFPAHQLHSHQHSGAIPFMPQQQHQQQTSVQSPFKPDQSSYVPSGNDGTEAIDRPAGAVIPLNSKVNSIADAQSEQLQVQESIPKLSSSMLYPDDAKQMSFVSSPSIIAAPFDYKQTLYWRGKLTYEGSYGKLWWKGKLVSSFSGKPTAEEYSWSTNEFMYASTDVISASDVLTDGTFSPPASVYFQGYYFMDNSITGIKEKHHDTQQYVEFNENMNQSEYVVLGQGTSNFGSFMLSGMFNATTQVLELCRIYATDSSMFQSTSSDVPPQMNALSEGV